MSQKNGSPLVLVLVKTVWILAGVFTLGFPFKYRERLRQFEGLMSLNAPPWTESPEYSDTGHDTSNKKTLRQKQQEEWDRLNITMSVITATSAAALAIQAVSQSTEIYWLVTAFYSIAFGLSLQGLILITYMTISAGGASDEAICRLANGKLLGNDSSEPVKPVAFMMALPAIFSTYSSISLLAGLVTMVVSGPGEGVQHRSSQYIKVTMIPVGIGSLCLVVAFLLCEFGTWVEMHGRRASRRRAQNAAAAQTTGTRAAAAASGGA